MSAKEDKFIVHIPSALRVTKDKLLTILNENIEGAWHEPITVKEVR